MLPGRKSAIRAGFRPDANRAEIQTEPQPLDNNMWTSDIPHTQARQMIRLEYTGRHPIRKPDFTTTILFSKLLHTCSAVGYNATSKGRTAYCDIDNDMEYVHL